MRLAGLDSVPVGVGEPFINPKFNVADLHGSDGMGGLSGTLPDLPAHCSVDTAPSSVVMIRNALTEFAGALFVLCTGPLTNLAAVETESPGILQKARSPPRRLALSTAGRPRSIAAPPPHPN